MDDGYLGSHFAIFYPRNRPRGQTEMDHHTARDVWVGEIDLLGTLVADARAGEDLESVVSESAMTTFKGPRCFLVTSKLVAALFLLTIIGCGERDAPHNQTSDSNTTQQVSVTRPALSATAQAGEEVFNAHCSLCHGMNAEGTVQGPTLIDSIYKPGHHSDFSIRTAVRQGVRQHHWSFGDMPPVSGVSSDDVEEIICYIREMQQANGIFPRDANLSTC